MSRVALGILLAGSCGMAPAAAFAPSAPSLSLRGGHTAVCMSSADTPPSSAERSLARRNFIAAAGLGVAALPLAAEAKSASPAYQDYARQDLAPPRPPASEEDVRFESGVCYKEYKEGSGDVTVEPGRTVNAQMTGRLLGLNGIKFYSTKEVKDEFGEAPALRWKFGTGEALPGLEEGMAGMKKGGLRKIVVPPSQGYAAYPNLLPQPSAAGRPSLDSVLKNPRRDSTIVFEVLIEGVR